MRTENILWTSIKTPEEGISNSEDSVLKLTQLHIPHPESKKSTYFLHIHHHCCCVSKVPMSILGNGGHA